jgi:hypothetical protein
MATGSLVSVREYLSTSYRPDCDYIDGVVLERNVGEKDHSRLQTEIAFYYRSHRKEWGLWGFVELRVQVAATRFRVPDVCLTLGDPAGPILTTHHSFALRSFPRTTAFQKCANVWKTT